MNYGCNMSTAYFGVTQILANVSALQYWWTSYQTTIDAIPNGGDPFFIVSNDTRGQVVLYVPV